MKKEAPVFVKIDDYKDVVDILDLIRDRISEAKKTLAELHDAKAEEDAEMQMWHATLRDIERKINDMDKVLFEPESMY